MIIKRNKANQTQSSNLSSDGKNASETDQSQSLNWTQDNLEKGLVQERRMGPRENRRDGFRRLEDKNLISRAHEEANAIRENAKREGFEEGLDEAQEEIQHLKKVLEELMISRETVLESVVDDIAPIAVEIAERIIKTEVACDDELIMGIVNDTLQKVSRKTKSILIKIHPEDVSLVKENLKANPIPNMDAEIMVMDDPVVDRGSCIVETNSGLIDASFSTRIEILKKLFGTNSP